MKTEENKKSMTAINMQGKMCLVTGSSSGIGKATAKELARMGAMVVMVCRNRTKGEAVQAEIKKVSGNAQVDLIVADLSELSQVRRAASEFTQKYKQLHVLINNAGGLKSEREVTPDGLEYAFVTNYLAPFLLTELLLDTLKASIPARIINVSSAGHTLGRIDFANLQGERQYSPSRAYADSKLAQLYYTYELAERLNGTGITVNALHPGAVASNFGDNLRGFVGLLGKFNNLVGTSADKGAQTTLYLATSPEVKSVSGKYFSKCKQTPSSKRSYDIAVRKRLWHVSEGLIRPYASLKNTKSY